MNRPITIRESTPYFEKHFADCDVTPVAYTSAFREAQFESRSKRQWATGIFWLVVLLAVGTWIFGLLHPVLLVIVCLVVWVVVNWHNQHDRRQLERTFALAIKNKSRPFKEYMWRHLDRSLLDSH